MQVTCFHNPNEENGYLSNWYLSDFSVDSVTFSSMEQYMMYKKAVCFDDNKVAAQILETDDVSKIKALGRKVSGYNDNIWNGVRQIVIYQGLLEKFTQNDELKEKLLKTGKSILAECAVRDMIWGIGLSMKDPDRFNMAKWRGQNKLGYALMMVRDQLQKHNPSTNKYSSGKTDIKRLHPDIIDHYNRHVVSMIMEKYRMTEMDAFRAFVKSKTHKMLEDSKYGMTEFGAGAIFEIWECERVTGDPRNSTYIRRD